MDGITDPRWVAAARWVFIFIRHQLRIGHTLNDIEKMLYSKYAEGELEKYMNTWELVNGEFRLKNGGLNGKSEIRTGV